MVIKRLIAGIRGARARPQRALQTLAAQKLQLFAGLHDALWRCSEITPTQPSSGMVGGTQGHSGSKKSPSERRISDYDVSIRLLIRPTF